MDRRDFLRAAGVAAAAIVCKGCARLDNSRNPGAAAVTTLPSGGASKPAASQKTGTQPSATRPGAGTPKLAACGIDCQTCEIGRAAKDRAFAEKLAESWRKGGNQKATADWFKCEGCHGRDHLVWCEDCKIRACCIKTKNLDDCSYCADFPCKLVTDFEADRKYPHHGRAVKKLRQIRAERNGTT
jgi:hypothetical protein